MERREEEKMEEEDESQAAAERSDEDEEEDKGVDGLDGDEDEEEGKGVDGLDEDGDEDEEEDKGVDGLDDGDEDEEEDKGVDDDDGGNEDEEGEDKGEDGLDDGDEDEEAPSAKRARLQSEAADQKKAGAPTDRKCLPGIVYLGHIPPRLRPRDMRNMLSHFGEIGRIFLQPENRFVRKMKKKRKVDTKRCSFTEGWVEFRDKRVAKRVAATLHNTPMSGKKRSRFHADLWCMKYLHRFHWTHLHERLAYERTVLKQRLRTEISQAKRETNFYLSNIEKSQSMDHLRKKREKRGEKVEEKQWEFTQRQTEEEIQLKKMKQKNTISQKHLAKAQDKARLIQEKSQSNVSLLAKIFNASKSQDIF